MLSRAGVQEDAQRLDRGGAQNDHPATHLVPLLREPVDEAETGGPPRIWVYEDVAHDRIGSKFQVAGREGGTEGRGLRAVGRPAGRLPGGEPGGDAPAMDHAPVGPARLDAGHQQPLARCHGLWREEHAVGQLREIVPGSVDAHEGFRFGIVGREVVAGDGPAGAVAMLGGLPQLVIGQPESDATPRQGPPAYLATANPAERLAVRGRVRMLGVVDEQVGMAEPVREVLALRTLRPREPVAIDPRRGQTPASPERVEARGNLVPGLQNEDAPAPLGQHLRRPSAGGSGAHHDRVVWLRLESDAHERAPEGAGGLGW
jgi:hypothetical protein